MSSKIHFAIALAFLGMTTSTANAGPAYTGLYVFGASLEDPGNVQAASLYVDSLPPPFPDLSDPTPASQGYFQGRFSNGYNFADVLSIALTGAPLSETFPYGLSGLPIVAPAPTGTSLSFAYGGALAIGDLPLRPSLTTQIDNYLAAKGTVDPGALYVVSIGGNDLGPLMPSTGPVSDSVATPILASVADAIIGQTSRLLSLGATNILVTSVPDGGILPLWNGLPDEAQRFAAGSAFSAELEVMLKDRIALLNLSPDQKITLFGFKDFTDDVLASPALYGFTNVTDACLALHVPSPNIDCSGFLFFDDVHFTAAADQQIAGRILNELPEPSTWMIMIGGFAAAPVVLRRRKRAVGSSQ